MTLAAEDRDATVGLAAYLLRCAHERFRESLAIPTAQLPVRIEDAPRNASVVWEWYSRDLEEPSQPGEALPAVSPSSCFEGLQWTYLLARHTAT